MFRVLDCLENQHDSWLVLLAACVCLLTSLAAVNLFQRARVGGGTASLMWLGTAGAVTGCGVWSTHFIAMLAYTPGFPIRYDLTTTAMSLVVATVMTTAGFATALLGHRRREAAVGGAMVGIGIAGMHYMGMASLRIPAEIVWMPDLVTVYRSVEEAAREIQRTYSRDLFDTRPFVELRFIAQLKAKQTIASLA